MASRAFARVPVVRAKLAILVTLAVTAWLTWRLADVQIRQSGMLSSLALAQHSETVDSFAKRGSILDRDGNVLYENQNGETTNICERACFVTGRRCCGSDGEAG